MSTTRLEAYLSGHTLESAREHARRLSEVEQCIVFVNVRARRRPGADEFIVSFIVSGRAGESVEAVFSNGREQAL